MKDRNPDRFYVFGSPDLSGYYLDAGRIGEHQAEYVARLLAAGGEATDAENRPHPGF